ncbi:hypothetical protein K402DRAFT_3222 [Aulographum hederae CBS 113979]|uniref:Uncharacterized protein n=1 Tax=Aulographum hederae CBS 113979 TaxID=1176131 RepID=A0A6G1HGV5_9PEZI|nr:hypothetical protein K402DRAFT_3222 [Aulographum hederae CBS 113979]
MTHSGKNKRKQMLLYAPQVTDSWKVAVASMFWSCWHADFAGTVLPTVKANDLQRLALSLYKVPLFYSSFCFPLSYLHCSHPSSTPNPDPPATEKKEKSIMVSRPPSYRSGPSYEKNGEDIALQRLGPFHLDENPDVKLPEPAAGQNANHAPDQDAAPQPNPDPERQDNESVIGNPVVERGRWLGAIFFLTSLAIIVSTIVSACFLGRLNDEKNCGRLSPALAALARQWLPRLFLLVCPAIIVIGPLYVPGSTVQRRLAASRDFRNTYILFAMCFTWAVTWSFPLLEWDTCNLTPSLATGNST